VALARPLRKRLGRAWQQEFGLVIALVSPGAYFTSRNSVFISLENLCNSFTGTADRAARSLRSSRA
jgi:hypothetical protein